MRLALIIFFSLMTFLGSAQETDTLKVMSYNLLKFPDVSPNRIDTLKEILAYVKPDIFMVCELTSGAGADDILFNALNEDGESDYDMADYIPGPDTENALYFNSAKLGLYSQDVVPTDLRDINEYILYYRSDDLETTTDTVFFYVYVCHLKASTGFEEQRNNEAIALKTHLNLKGYTENILVGGDFNLYGSDTEPAWETILTGGGVTIKDPISTPGHWHADPGFGWLHTQSTRGYEEFDGGAWGGMDDRFDFIFIGDDLRTFANDARYISGSYRAIGQDGLHFNTSILESPTNTSEPASIISNLFYMSDHLPVYLEIEVISHGAGIQEQEVISGVYFDAENDRIIVGTSFEDYPNAVFAIYAVSGQLIARYEVSEEGISTVDLDMGTYILKMEGTNLSFKFVKS